MPVNKPPLVQRADLIFAFKTFAAAMLALPDRAMGRPAAALLGDGHRLYHVAAPRRRDPVRKRFTACSELCLAPPLRWPSFPNFVNAPELLSLVIALWVGGCLYLSLLDRTPRSYLFMLGGYTITLIGFPVVSDPSTVFDTAVARTEEIILGIVCASLVSTIVLPRSVAPVVGAKLDSWLTQGPASQRGRLERAR